MSGRRRRLGTDRRTACRLGQLEAGVVAYGVAQFVSQRGLLLVVGQLEQVEAGGRGGQPGDRGPTPHREEAAQHRPCGTHRQTHGDGWGHSRAAVAPCMSEQGTNLSGGTICGD